MARLQLALDFADTDRALAAAREAAPYVDIIEAGTPLIKSEGLDIVRRLRREFPKKTLVADMKIMDTGALEVEIASKAGADIITILGAADISTIREGIEASRRFGSAIMVDILNVSDAKIREIEGLHPDYLCLHVSIDQQHMGVDVFERMRKLRVRTRLAVAGGLNAATAGEAAAQGAEIIIVGGGITKAPDAAEAARKIRDAIAKRKRAGKRETPGQILSRVSTCNISDALQRKGSLGYFPVVLNPGALNKKLVFGKALTCRTIDGDWAKPVELIDSASKGDILVIDVMGGKRAVFGGLAAESCKQKGVAAVIINGAARDAEEIEKAGVLVIARTITSCAGEANGAGEIGCEVEIGGTAIRHGDIIVIDKSGAVCIPQERFIEITNKAADVKEKEARVRSEIRKGSTLGSVLKLKKWELRHVG